MATSLVAFVWLVGSRVPADRFGYDEADYMYAASKGFKANYFDEPTIPIGTFLARGISEATGGGSASSLSEFIRDADDIAFYRHFHGPLYHYFIIAQVRLFGTDERKLRAASVALVFMTFVLVYLGCQMLAREQGALAGVIASAMVLHSPANILTAMELTPHALFVPVVVVALVLMARLIQTGGVRYWYGAVIATCLALLTMEYAVLLVITLLMTVIWARPVFKEWGRTDARRAAAWSGMAVLGTFAMLWLGGLSKLTIAKNYIFFAYFALRRSESYGTDSVVDVWLNRIMESPLEYVVIGVSIVAAVLSIARDRGRRWLLPMLCYAALLFLTTFRNRSSLPTYVSSLFPPLYIVSGAMLASLAAVWPSVARAVAAAGLVAALWLGASQHPRIRAANTPDVSLNGAVALFERAVPRNSDVLVPWRMRPTLHYYFPTLRLTTYEPGASPSELIERAQVRGLDGVLYVGPGGRTLEHMSLEPRVRAERVVETGPSDEDVVYYGFSRSSS